MGEGCEVRSNSRMGLRRTLSGRDYELQPTAYQPSVSNVTSSAPICSIRSFLDWSGLPKD
jgi:hypothetical protein